MQCSAFGERDGVVFASGVTALGALCLRQELIDLFCESGHGLFIRHAERPYYPRNSQLKQI